MQKPDFEDFRLPLRNDNQQLEKLSYWEISAEQLIQYLAPGMSRKNLLQVLMVFEFGKAYYGIRSLFNHRQNSAQANANPKEVATTEFKEKMINAKRQEILALTKRSKVQSAANMSRADVIKRIESILGVKKIGLSKREIMGELEQVQGGSKTATRELESVTEDPNAENTVATPKMILGENDLFKKKKSPKTFKYIKSDTSAVSFHNLDHKKHLLFC